MTRPSPGPRRTRVVLCVQPASATSRATSHIRILIDHSSRSARNLAARGGRVERLRATPGETHAGPEAVDAFLRNWSTMRALVAAGSARRPVDAGASLAM